MIAADEQQRAMIDTQLAIQKQVGRDRSDPPSRWH
jgi:hypothetical protein